jgi:hypothetical protein
MIWRQLGRRVMMMMRRWRGEGRDRIRRWELEERPALDGGTGLDG